MSNEIWRKYQVEAKSLDDFLDRYYKQDRYKGRDNDIWGQDYSKQVRHSSLHQLINEGVAIISPFDSKTGEFVAYFKDCACVSDNALQCFSWRYPNDNEDENHPEYCNCPCHGEIQEDYDREMKD